MEDEKCQHEDSQVGHLRPHGKEVFQRRSLLFFDDQKDTQAKRQDDESKIVQFEKSYEKTLSIVHDFLHCTLD